MSKKKTKKKNKFLSAIISVLIILVAMAFLGRPTGIEVIDNSKVFIFLSDIGNQFRSGNNINVPATDGLELPAPIKGHQIVNHTGYTLSWNKEMLAADWVAYELTAEEVNSQEASRKGESFKADPSVFTSPEENDYKGVGNLRPHPAARGHLAPAADFHWSAEAMADTFYYTNVCVQYQFYNAGIWLQAEDAVRNCAEKTGKVYVVTGPVLTDGPYEKFKDKLNIFKSFYKALLVVTDNGTEAVALVIPQDANKKTPLIDFAMSINELEELTKIDFFPALEDSVEEQIESSYNKSFWVSTFK